MSCSDDPPQHRYFNEQKMTPSGFNLFLSSVHTAPSDAPGILVNSFHNPNGNVNNWEHMSFNGEKYAQRLCTPFVVHTMLSDERPPLK